MKIFIKHLVFAFMVLGLSGFDYSKHNTLLDKIVGGGQAKDGIPAIIFPEFLCDLEANQRLLKLRLIDAL